MVIRAHALSRVIHNNLPEDLKKFINLRIPWEKWMLCDHFRKNTANRPHIDWRGIVVRAKQNLWCSVPECHHLHNIPVILYINTYRAECNYQCVCNSLTRMDCHSDRQTYHRIAMSDRAKEPNLSSECANRYTECSSKTKISQLQRVGSSIHKEILRLQVAMQNEMSMTICETSQHLEQV